MISVQRSHLDGVGCVVMEVVELKGAVALQCSPVRSRVDGLRVRRRCICGGEVAVRIDMKHTCETAIIVIKEPSEA